MDQQRARYPARSRKDDKHGDTQPPLWAGRKAHTSIEETLQFFLFIAF